MTGARFTRRRLSSTKQPLDFRQDESGPPPYQIDDDGHLRLELLVRIWLDWIGEHRLANLFVRALGLLPEPVGMGRRLHRLDEKAGVETAQFRIFECSPYQWVLRRTVRDRVVPLKESIVLIPRQELMALSGAVPVEVEVVHARKADDAVCFGDEHVRRNETQRCGEIEAHPHGVAKALPRRL